MSYSQLFTLKNFDRLKNNVYNLGLSSANITKLDLAKKKKICQDLKIKIEKTKKTLTEGIIL